MIRFEEITNKNIWKVCVLEPFESQKEFVAENTRALQKHMLRGMKATMHYLWLFTMMTISSDLL